ncbi:co-chaperone HscB [Pseudoalteromonas tunicata]|uniref:Co-chaperone protein HscB homolog n=1 Tax=Pseudoalteromonas tunicata D2 TaxID=87626 RepID=A4C7G9_9GAMM|nr:co-chaperone HscB [Pseudoalteromonas tunicata]ATC95893.1 molecular chaperone HscB [Pseudoalteromonas tunicata]AXT31436.1 co-chaperone HscB [Pseudoalteromonas tunicata]EAR29923.1 co-chaperone HscB [Pseudoalteromonas tunicata D2]MDP4984821.1 co-chaperone HscB [Pseudoalteromonas tunicata]MDP5214257.1 co-chaperone HscB [Pseudoalteromonas tunicata]
MRYFDLLSLPVDYQVDLTLLNAHYLELQKVIHPDKFANHSEQEQLLAVQKAAEVNDALQTLKHPLKRAEYMLAERGVDIRAEQQTLQDPMFLMQQMELREALEEISSAAEPEDAIADIEQQIKQLMSTLHQELLSLISSSETAAQHKAADVVRKLKFIYKLKDELARIEDSLFED